MYYYHLLNSEKNTYQTKKSQNKFNINYEKKINELLGGYIRKKRKTLGLSGHVIAGKIGISQQQYSRYEGGSSSMTLAKLLLIISQLGVNPNDFTEDFMSIVELIYKQNNSQKN